ncbi:hypothetical protein SARC_07663 [Sphaeroforma arctica JP610]|uniref:Uncharacterized protein n=1 Tax=Sphaeroforma arctica JP610 TaxID=667725 RepID=A0A0L0FT38_9EUKA|nr:hypothetical protein SARC_07663 [Sphaeroforma arctica JP610]KNC79965.1 hypothetical protein SARC_07663 [Sphaeroforma arctica JP610]|eukprot:XP_014153867.1 hypothetical protein SARC_07663 [Sphaeroforma arctica JP610]
MLVRNGKLEDVVECTRRILNDPWYDRLTKRVIVYKGVPFWVVDDSFVPEWHMSKVNYDSDDKRMPKDDTQLMKWIGREIGEDLPIDRPLWKITVLENFRKCDDGSGDFISCVVLRVHHVLADGVSLMSMLNSMMTTQSELEAIKSNRPVPPRGHMSPLVNKIHPRPWLLALYAAMYALPVLLGHAISRSDVNPFKTQHVEGKKVVGMLHDTIDIKKIKAVKNRLGMSINDVLMGVLGAACHRVWAKLDGVEGADSFLAAIPVNMRAGTERSVFNNLNAAIVLPVPTDSADPFVACEKIKLTLDYYKRHPIVYVNFLCMLTMMRLFPAHLVRMIIEFMTNKTTAVVSNVPGPTEIMFMGDKQIESLGFWAPQVGTSSFGVTLVSIGGKLSVGCILDAGASDKSQLLCDEYRAAFNDLEKIVLEGETMPIKECNRDDGSLATQANVQMP